MPVWINNEVSSKKAINVRGKKKEIKTYFLNLISRKKERKK